jgi:F0F1-type ATP synthase delta subunit
MQVATHLADAMTSGRPDAVQHAAAWLVATGRTRQAEYLVRDVASVLAKRGYVTVRVTTARPLASGTRARLEELVTQLTGAKQLELELAVDPKLVGGAIIETPDASMDFSVKTKLARYVEGVIS